MRGFFGIGAERISKPMNFGAIMRTANAFDASFVFSVGAAQPVREMERSDTSRGMENIAFYEWDGIEDMILPAGCVLVGVELTDDAEDLPSFLHPKAAAYILGPERGSLSQPVLDRCAHVVKIPTKFCVNVSVAAALIMYDRLLSRGKRPARPLSQLATRESAPRR